MRKQQCIECWGDYAYFGNSMYGAHRQSYEIPTPAAIVGIFEAIYWHPGVKWVPDEIQIMRPVQYVSIMRNELRSVMNKWDVDTLGPYHVQAVRSGDAERVQRSDRILRDVRYRLFAHLETEPDNFAKHINIFERRAQRGQCVHQPYFGAKEYVANFRWVDLDDPQEALSLEDLYEPTHRGIMHYGWDWSGKKPIPQDYVPQIIGRRVYINPSTCQIHDDAKYEPYPVILAQPKKPRKTKQPKQPKKRSKK